MASRARGRMETVLFDWDGTLLDSYAASRDASLSVYRHYGHEMDEARFRAVYQPDWHAAYRRLGVPEAEWDAASDRWSAAYRERAGSVRLLPGVAGTLDRLRGAGLRLGVVTNADRDRFEADADRLGVLAFFEATVAFEDAERKKPHPEALLLALSRLGCAPGTALTALFVGDRHEDVEMGRRAGVRTAALPSAFSDRERLLAAGPDLVLTGIADLPDLLDLPDRALPVPQPASG